MVIKINSFEEFKKAIESSNCLVDCYADWCGPCKMLAPLIDEISESRTDFKFYKVNIDEVEEVANRYNIQAIPCLLVFKNGEFKESSIGYKPIDEINKILDKISVD